MHQEPHNKTSSDVGRKKAGRAFLLVGITLLTFSLFLTGYNLASGRLGRRKQTVEEERIKKLHEEIKAAEPRFEIGYTGIRIDLFRELQAKGAGASQEGITDLLAYPVTSNDVTTRIKTNSPPLEPDFANMPLHGSDLSDFKSLKRRNRVKMGPVTVVCLVVKQVGKGKADDVVLTTQRSVIDGGAYMFDYTELEGGDETGENGPPMQQPQAIKEFAEQKLELGAMDTGTAFLIPLYLANFFERLDKDNPGGGYIVSGVLYKPLVVQYVKASTGSLTQVPVKGVFSLPLDIRRQN